jgi:hypothetical protein
MPVETVAPLEISSVEDGVYRILREEIGRLDLAPGERLRLEEVAGRLEVSLTPVRHALRRLESEGLVVSIPRRRLERRIARPSRSSRRSRRFRLGLETFSPAREPSASPTARSRDGAGARPRWSARSAPATSTPTSAPSGRSATPATPAPSRPRLLRALEDQRIRVERYILYLCRDPEAFAALRRGPDTLLEACRAPGRRGRPRKRPADALVWVLAELQRMLGDRRRLRPDELLLDCPNCGPRDVNEFSCAGEVTGAPEGVAHAPRADELHLLSPQRRRSAARVVVPPPGLRDLVPGRARHETNEVLRTEIFDPAQQEARAE